MQRRSFLWLSFASTAALTVPSWYCSNREATLVKTLSVPVVLSGFCDANTLKEIGNQYRQKTPAENAQDKLQQLLQQAAGTKKAADHKALRSSIQATITEDFKAGRIININGWVLSVTEARQCALFSIL